MQVRHSDLAVQVFPVSPIEVCCFKLFSVHLFAVLKCETLSHIFIIRDIRQESCQVEPAILLALGGIIGIWQQKVDS